MMKIIMDEKMIQRSLKRMAHEILERNKGCQNVVLLGIKTRGEHLAKRLADNIYEIEGSPVLWDAIDISFWRDDIKEKSQPKVALNVDVKDKIVVLVDDVFYKGRTVRSAMDGVMHYGRAKSIQLAVLIDRGHRELPIRADYIGKNLPTSLQEEVNVHLIEIDEIENVILK